MATHRTQRLEILLYTSISRTIYLFSLRKQRHKTSTRRYIIHNHCHHSCVCTFWTILCLSRKIAQNKHNRCNFISCRYSCNDFGRWHEHQCKYKGYNTSVWCCSDSRCIYNNTYEGGKPLPPIYHYCKYEPYRPNLFYTHTIDIRLSESDGCNLYCKNIGYDSLLGYCLFYAVVCIFQLRHKKSGSIACQCV